MLASVAVALILLLLSAPPCACATGTAAHRTLQTRYASVSYTDAGGLIEFGRRIGPGSASLVRDNDRARALVKEELDRMVFRVRSLLDMYPPDFHFEIVILKTYADVKLTYAGLGMAGPAPIAFYRQKSHTIYLGLDRLTPGVLGHEIAHAVINAFFPTPPPAQMQEILARYVDRHLPDK